MYNRFSVVCVYKSGDWIHADFSLWDNKGFVKDFPKLSSNNRRRWDVSSIAGQLVVTLVGGIIVLIIEYAIIKPHFERLSQSQQRQPLAWQPTAAIFFETSVKVVGYGLIILFLVFLISPFALAMWSDVISNSGSGEGTPTPPQQQTAMPSPTPKSLAWRLDDVEWHGGRHRFLVPNSNPAQYTDQYAGRTAVAIYATSTQTNTIQTEFRVPSQPVGTSQLTIEGMDSENTGKTTIIIMVNGQQIYNGPNPLPDDDHDLLTGTWGSYSWSFSASLLHEGQNEISISNLDEGNFGRPPWFMLDYADLTVEVEIP